MNVGAVSSVSYRYPTVKSSTNPSFRGNDGGLWNDKDKAEYQVRQLQEIIGAVAPKVPKKKNPLVTLGTILAVGVLGGITAGFVIKQGMEKLNAFGINTTKIAESAADGLAKVGNQLSNIPISENEKVATAQKTAQKLSTSIMGGLQKIAEFGMSPDKIATATNAEKLQNGLINLAAIGAGVGSAYNATQKVIRGEEAEENIGELLQEQTNKTLEAITNPQI